MKRKRLAGSCEPHLSSEPHRFQPEAHRFGPLRLLKPGSRRRPTGPKICKGMTHLGREEIPWVAG